MTTYYNIVCAGCGHKWNDVELTNSMVACTKCHSIAIAQRQNFKLFPKRCASCKIEASAIKINELICPICSSELKYDTAKVAREFYKVQLPDIGDIVHAYYEKEGRGKLTVVDIHDHCGYIENDSALRQRNKVMECKVVDIQKVRIVLAYVSDVT